MSGHSQPLKDNKPGRFLTRIKAFLPTGFHPSWDKLCLINWPSHSLNHALCHTHLRTILPIHRSQQSRQGPKLEHKPIFIPNVPHQNQCLHVRLYLAVHKLHKSMKRP
ncbi:hypothetical protein NXS19_014384 [Fusarium pseudograminearum]|nr:hypothetical protein NXS19_014384 [Fusarium pseudograminearum]